MSVDGRIYISNNAGSSWALAYTVSGNANSVTMSADGRVIAVGSQTVVYISVDGGASWASPTSGLSGGQIFDSLACSADGSKIVAVAVSGGVYAYNTETRTWTPTMTTSNLTGLFWYGVTSSADGEEAYIEGDRVYHQPS